MLELLCSCLAGRDWAWHLVREVRHESRCWLCCQFTSFTSGSQELAVKLKGSLEAEFGCSGSGQANTGAQRKESLVSQFVAAECYLYQQQYPQGL